MYNFFKILTLVFVIIGAINWGLVGAFRFDLVAAIFGQMSVVTRIIYCLVGLFGVVALVMLPYCIRKMD